MAVITESQLKADIKKKNFDSVYFFYGDEQFLCEHYSELIVKKSVDRDFIDFNLFRLNGNENTVDDAITAIEQLPMMAETKCVILRDYLLPDIATSDYKKLCAALENSAGYCITIVCFESISVNPKEKAGWKKIISYFEKNFTTCCFKHLSRPEAVKQIRAMAGKRGLTVDEDAANILSDYTCNDLRLLVNELDKLSSYCNQTISAEAVKKLVSSNIDADAFRFAEAIIRGQGQNAYSMLNDLYALKYESILILGALIGKYIDIYRVKTAVASGKRPAEVARYYDYKRREFVLDKANAIASGISEEQLFKSLKSLTLADEKLKSFSGDDRLVMEKLVAELLLISSGT